MSPFSLRRPAQRLPALLCPTLLPALLAAAPGARAQGIGAHRGEVAGTGGSFNIEGRIISPLGKLPDTRVRVMLEHTDTPTRSTVAGDDGAFFFSNLEGGTYAVTIDAGKEYETARESVYVEEGKVTYNVPVYLRLKPEANPALAGVPKPALDLFQKGLDAERKGDKEKAAALLGEAVAQEVMRRLDDSERELLQSVKLGGDPAGRVHYYLGGVYWGKHSYKKAADELELYVKQSPRAPDAEQVRASIKELRGKS